MRASTAAGVRRASARTAAKGSRPTRPETAASPATSRERTAREREQTRASRGAAREPPAAASSAAPRARWPAPLGASSAHGQLLRRARLLASLAAEPASARAGVAARFAAIFDVSLERARALLARVDDPDAWEAGPAPGTWLIHFEAGPACAGADTGFVRCAPGTTFPWHRHLGAEHNLVLAGHADDSRFGRLGPGDEATADGDTEHDFTVVGDRPFLYAVRVFGVDFTVPRPA
ncbi:MAG: cupin domain-containing protein [Kofleriaceae bacterium]|nr:cupin domain-containing protein [Kofleriaceae bacterium]